MRMCECAYIYIYIYIYIHNCTNAGRQVAVATKFCTATHNVCGSTVRNLRMSRGVFEGEGGVVRPLRAEESKGRKKG
jgi:predicted nucleic acid-binding Zn ribbon protein